MSVLKKVAKGSALLATGSVGGKILALARNIILARLLMPEDFGIAATFILAIGILMTVSEVGADKLLVQAKDGDDERVQRTLHFYQCARALVVAVILFVFAGPIANLFSAPETTSAFRCLALIPLIRAFNHLDLRRVQRRLSFKPVVAVDLTSQIVALLVAVPLALWFRDYWAALWVLVVQAVVYAAGTHILAERPFRLAFHREYIVRLLRFGWPLIINALLMFAIIQGDRMVIAAGFSPYTLDDLGVYSVAITLVMTPRHILTSVIGSLLLPLMARVQDQEEVFQRRYTLCIQFSTIFASLIGVIFVCAGPLMVILLFGSKYAGVQVFIGWLAVAMTFRIVRTIPSLAAMARADTQQMMWTNMVRGITLVFLIPIAIAGLGLNWIAAAGAGGEVLALLASAILVTRRHSIPLAFTLGPALVAGCVLAGAGLAAASGLATKAPMIVSVGTLAIVALSGLLLLALLPDARRLLQTRVLTAITASGKRSRPANLPLGRPDSPAS